MSVTVAQKQVCRGQQSALAQVAGCIPGFGPRCVAPGLRVDGSEGEVDPRPSIVVLFGHLVLPVVLSGSFHQEQGAVAQRDFNVRTEGEVSGLLRGRDLAEAEGPSVPQTEGGDGGVRSKRRLVIAVPRDTVMAASIKVTQDRVQTEAEVREEAGTEGEEVRRPLSVGRHGGVGVRVRQVSKPTGQTWLLIRFSSAVVGLLTPGQLLQESGEHPISFLRGQEVMEQTQPGDS